MRLALDSTERVGWSRFLALVVDMVRSGISVPGSPVSRLSLLGRGSKCTRADLRDPATHSCSVAGGLGVQSRPGPAQVPRASASLLVAVAGCQCCQGNPAQRKAGRVSNECRQGRSPAPSGQEQPIIFWSLRRLPPTTPFPCRIPHLFAKACSDMRGLAKRVESRKLLVANDLQAFRRSPPSGC